MSQTEEIEGSGERYPEIKEEPNLDVQWESGQLSGCGESYREIKEELELDVPLELGQPARNRSHFF